MCVGGFDVNACNCFVMCSRLICSCRYPPSFAQALVPTLTDQNGQAEELGVQHALFGEVQACLGVHLAHTALCFDQEVECVLLCRS